MDARILFFLIFVGVVVMVGWTAFVISRVGGSPLKSVARLEAGIVWTVDLRKISARGDTIAIVSREHGGAVIERLLNLGTSDHGIPGAGDQFVVLEDGTVKRII